MDFESEPSLEPKASVFTACPLVDWKNLIHLKKDKGPIHHILDELHMNMHFSFLDFQVHVVIQVMCVG